MAKYAIHIENNSSVDDLIVSLNRAKKNGFNSFDSVAIFGDIGEDEVRIYFKK
tara:strand:+ start:5141 stop:5299 length:159 start_codon:yes stop_codon:yes gene_type:complete